MESLNALPRLDALKITNRLMDVSDKYGKRFAANPYEFAANG